MVEGERPMPASEFDDHPNIVVLEDVVQRLIILQQPVHLSLAKAYTFQDASND
jgi:hypothetical protein